MKTTKECSDLIYKKKDEIISEWEKEVRKKVLGAGTSSSLALRNQLSDLLDDISTILNERQQDGDHYKPDDYMRTMEKNKLHGKLRAETENYTIDQVIQEYFILHQIIRSVLEGSKVLNKHVIFLLSSIFESVILDSSSSFSRSIQDIQDKMVGTLAHDIRNPLTTALSALELMARNPNGQEKLIHLAQKSLERSISLAEGLLDTISVKSGQGMMMQFSEDNYCSLIKEVCEEASISYQQKVSYELIKEEVIGNFDRVAVRRLLDNLLSNAVKHGKSSEEIKILLAEDEDYAVITVINYGKPVSLEKQESIFNFLSHDDGADQQNEEKSWGMGLTLVKLIADAHEGSVSLTSDEANGTRFSIYLKKKLKYMGKVRMRL